MRTKQKQLLLLMAGCYAVTFSFAQCTGCTLTNPTTLPGNITTGQRICITVNKSYSGAFVINGGTLSVCGNATLTLNGAFQINSGLIFLGDCGSQLSISGAYADPGTISAYSDCSSCSSNLVNNSVDISTASLVCASAVLPVELSAFTADCWQQQARLQWTTHSEHNSAYFHVCKSTDALSWRVIAEVKAAGNTTLKTEYEAYDTTGDAATLCYYKLRQMDVDGSFTDSKLLVLSCNEHREHSLQLFPNPLSCGETLTLIGPPGWIELNDCLAKTLKRMYHDGGKLDMELDDLAPGIYILRLTGSSAVLNKKLVRH